MTFLILEKFARKLNKVGAKFDEDDDSLFGEALFKKIVSLLSDFNFKCRLAASIATFTWIRSLSMPLAEIHQTAKDKVYFEHF